MTYIIIIRYCVYPNAAHLIVDVKVGCVIATLIKTYTDFALHPYLMSYVTFPVAINSSKS